MISVCMATYNGAPYVREQLDSILAQLGPGDEVVVSDDSSTDGTPDIVEAYADPRIRVFRGNTFHSPVFNFENAIRQARGEYIFLADQDDVWLDGKVERMTAALADNDMVVSDCMVTDRDLNVTNESFMGPRPSAGLLANLARNRYLGCCMAFRRRVLDKALPFPGHTAMHDIWLGLVAAAFYRPVFIPEKLMLLRRHGDNASCTAAKSNLSIGYRIRYRLAFAASLLRRAIGR